MTAVCSTYICLKLTEGMYQKYSLKRVFYSAYIPVAEDTRLPALDLPTAPSR